MLYYNTYSLLVRISRRFGRFFPIPLPRSWRGRFENLVVHTKEFTQGLRVHSICVFWMDPYQINGLMDHRSDLYRWIYNDGSVFRQTCVGLFSHEKRKSTLFLCELECQLTKWKWIHGKLNIGLYSDIQVYTKEDVRCLVVQWVQFSPYALTNTMYILPLGLLALLLYFIYQLFV